MTYFQRTFLHLFFLPYWQKRLHCFKYNQLSQLSDRYSLSKEKKKEIIGFTDKKY